MGPIPEFDLRPLLFLAGVGFFALIYAFIKLVLFVYNHVQIVW